MSICFRFDKLNERAGADFPRAHAPALIFLQIKVVFIHLKEPARARELWRIQSFGEKGLLNFQRVVLSHLRAAALCDIPAAALKVWKANFCINALNEIFVSFICFCKLIFKELTRIFPRFPLPRASYFFVFVKIDLFFC